MPEYKTFQVEIRLFYKKQMYFPEDGYSDEICEILNDEVGPTQKELDDWMTDHPIDGGDKRYIDFVKFLYVCSYGDNLKNIKYHASGRITFEISENRKMQFNETVEEVRDNILTDSFEDSFYEGQPGSTLVYPSKNLPNYEIGLIDCRHPDCIDVVEL